MFTHVWLNRIRGSVLAASVGGVLLATAAVPQLNAAQVDKKTVLKFDAPVQIGATTLAPGTYVFKTLQDDRNILVITNKAESHLVALVPTVPIKAVSTSENVKIQFSQTPGRGMESISAYYYPGDDYGWSILPAPADKVTPAVANAD